MFRIKSQRPEIYGTKNHRRTGPNGLPDFFQSTWLLGNWYDVAGRYQNANGGPRSETRRARLLFRRRPTGPDIFTSVIDEPASYSDDFRWGSTSSRRSSTSCAFTGPDGAVPFGKPYNDQRGILHQLPTTTLCRVLFGYRRVYAL